MGLTPTLRATRVAMRRTWARVWVVWGDATEQQGRVCERTCAVGKLSRIWTSGFASLLVVGEGPSQLSAFFSERPFPKPHAQLCALVGISSAALTVTCAVPLFPRSGRSRLLP